jgi:anti-sigma factor RsiW
MTARDFSERDIHMALDGELPADERAAFERWLDANPEMKAKQGRYAADRERLSQALDAVLAEPAPDRLTRIVTGDAPRRADRSWIWRAAAAAAIFVVGGAGGYLANTYAPWTRAEAGEQFAEAAIAAHVTYTSDRAHQVEVGAGDKEYLVRWLSNRTGLKLVAPDLAEKGFELVGGRLLPGAKRPAALMLYKGREGDELSVYVTAEADERARGTYLGKSGGPEAIYWLNEGYGCAIVGTLASDQLSEVARSAWRQLVDATKS